MNFSTSVRGASLPTTLSPLRTWTTVTLARSGPPSKVALISRSPPTISAGVSSTESSSLGLVRAVPAANLNSCQR